MSGRGKGGKVTYVPFTVPFTHHLVLQGLGKGGAKRHRKILRDNIQGESLSCNSSVFANNLLSQALQSPPFAALHVVVV